MTYTDYVVKHQHAGVWPVCKCGKRKEWHKGGFPAFCSRSCAASGEDNAMGRLKGTASPNYGQRRTEEQKKNYSAAAIRRWTGEEGEQRRAMMQTNDYRTLQSNAQRILYDTTNHAEKVSKGINHFWATSPRAPQLRREASDRAIVLLEQNKIGPRAPFKTCLMLNPFTNRQERMHSSWETAFLARCISENYPVTKMHDLKIPYVSHDGTEHQYVPDFVALDNNVVFEVKGLMRPDDDHKLAALQAWADANGHEVVLVDYLSK